jgi:hypothetical protein
MVIYRKKEVVTMVFIKTLWTQSGLKGSELLE